MNTTRQGDITGFDDAEVVDEEQEEETHTETTANDRGMKVLIDIDEDKFDLVQMAVVNGLKSSDMVYKAVAMGTIIDDNTESKTKENKEECRE